MRKEGKAAVPAAACSASGREDGVDAEGKGERGSGGEREVEGEGVEGVRLTAFDYRQSRPGDR
jgi:hypothetical protein